MRFNFSRCNGQWYLKVILEDGQESKIVELKDISTEEVTTLATLLAKGDINEVDVNYTNLRM